MQSYKAELAGIKAPLGLILYLIKRDNIDIYDIPIAKITKDYLAHLDLMEQLQIDLAGEFFVMAATLMRIKVQMLLHRDSDDDDPREELVRNLIEYKKMVEASRALQEMEAERHRVFMRPVPQTEKDFEPETELDLNLFEIMRAFRQIMAEYEADDVGEILLEEFSIEDKIELMRARIEETGQIRFSDLFRASSSRLEVVITFIALLEMMKQLQLTARQEGTYGEIWLYKQDQQPPWETDTPPAHTGPGQAETPKAGE